MRRIGDIMWLAVAVAGGIMVGEATGVAARAIRMKASALWKRQADPRGHLRQESREIVTI